MRDMPAQPLNMQCRQGPPHLQSLKRINYSKCNTASQACDAQHICAFQFGEPEAPFGLCIDRFGGRAASIIRNSTDTVHMLHAGYISNAVFVKD